MKRLTQRIDMGLDEFDEIAFINPHDPEGLYNLRNIVDDLDDDELLPIAERLAEYEDTGLEPEEIKRIQDNIRWANAFAPTITRERYEEICVAERNGRLVVLPCKVGSLVYWFTGAVIIPCTVYGYVIDNEGNLRMELPEIDCTPIYPYPGRISLTRKEAEKTALRWRENR